MNHRKFSYLLNTLIFLLLIFFSLQETVFYLVPHTHQDPGWIQTFEEYAKRATRKSFQTFQNFGEKFIYQEMSFLDDALKQTDLNPETLNRMEIVGGGWTLADEACPIYQDYIRNMEVGHRFVQSLYIKNNKSLNIQSLWNIDPFGHSKTISLSLAISMGMKYVVLNRISRDLKEKWRENQNLQFYWCLKEDQCILVHILSDHYAAPPGFHFDGDGDKDSFTSEESLANKICEHANKTQTFYKSNHILAPYGDDFTHVTSQSIENLKKVLKYITDNNSCPGIIFKISNLDTYFKGMLQDLKDRNINLSKYTYDDFFPYNQIKDSNNDFWTGYFTSHPMFKRLIRESSNALRTSEIITSLHMIQDNFSKDDQHKKHDFKSIKEKLEKLSQQVALMQHHDAITGTSKKKVRNEYKDDLTNAMKYATTELSNSLKLLLGEHHDSSIKEIPTLNLKKEIKDEDILDIKQGVIYPIVIVNNLGYQRSSFVSLRVSNEKLNVYALEANSNKKITVQQEKVLIDGKTILHFYASLVPAFGFKTYFIEYDENSQKIQETQSEDGSFELSNEFVKLKFKDYKSNSIQASRPDSGESTFTEEKKFETELFYYTTTNNQGAYVFNADKKEELKFINPKMYVVSGKHVSIVRIVLDESKVFDTTKLPVSITYSLYKNVDATLDILPIDITITSNFNNVFVKNIDLVFGVNTIINNNDTFYTDSNGYHIMERKRSAKSISGDYYPATQCTWISDNEFTVSFLIREPHGVSSQNNNTLEIALARQSIRDDGKGLGEEISEEEFPTVSRFQLAYFQGGFDLNRKNFIPEYKLRNLARSFDHPFSVYAVIDEKKKSAEDYKNDHKLSFTPLQNVDLKLHFLHFAPYFSDSDSSNKYLLRLHNTDRTNFISDFDLSNAFQYSDLDIANMTEYTLTLLEQKEHEVNPKKLTFGANEIRTFLIEFRLKSEPEPVKPVPEIPKSPILVYLMGGTLILFAFIGGALLILLFTLGVFRRGWFKNSNQQQWSLLSEFNDDSSEELQIVNE